MKRAIVFIVLSVFALANLAAQNLLNNDAYNKAVELRNEAQRALDSGNYDQAQQLSEQAQQYAKQAVDVAKQLEATYSATNWLNLAKQRIEYGKSIDASSRYPSDWKNATNELSTAQSTFDAKDYQKSIAASRAVVDALKGIAPAPAVAEKTLPQYYTVRLIPNRRDCFWRIAAYPFVYGDPFKWPLLYQANKDKLQDPNNPDLIQPGMVFIIPSVDGEKRSGVYKPDDNGKDNGSGGGND